MTPTDWPTTAQASPKQEATSLIAGLHFAGVQMGGRESERLLIEAVERLALALTHRAAAAAERMRESSARVAEQERGVLLSAPWTEQANAAGKKIAAAIRALPLDTP